MRAVDFLPGDRTVLHHIIATMGSEWRGVREAAASAAMYPARDRWSTQETGVLIKKGAKFFFQMHYTVSGKPARDVSRMGMYFRKDAPKYQIRSAVMSKPIVEDSVEHQGSHRVGLEDVRPTT